MSVATATDSEFPTSWEQYQRGNWPYDVVPLNPEEHDDAATYQGLHEFAFKAENGGVYAGAYARAMINNAANTEQPLMIGASARGNQSVGILHKERYRHIFCGGITGAGKTVAAKNAVQQDAFAGNGYCFIDPGGEDILDIVRSLPDYRLDDLIYMEPGNEYRSHSIGLNYLDTLHEPGEPGYKKECESIATNLLPMLNADEYARMKGVASNMLRYLIKADYEDSEYDYTLIDLYYMLASDDARAAYADKVQQDKLEFLKPYADKIGELADNDLEPLIRRLQTWVENDVIRPFIAQRDSDFSIADAVSNQRIVLVKANLGQNEREMITAALTTKLWSAITSRPNADERKMMEYEGVDVPDLGGAASEGEGHKPFFLVADEFHAVASENTDIGEMLAMARKKGLGLYILTQQLGQLSNEQQEQILGNCSTLMAFEPGRSSSERKALAGGFDGVSETDFGIGRYKFWTTLTDENGDESQAFLTHSTPPYPPVRTVKEANKALNQSQQKYGSKRLSDEDILSQIPDEFSISAAQAAVGGDTSGELDALVGNDRAERIVLKRIYDATIRHGDRVRASEIPDSVAQEAVADEFDLSMTQVSDMIEAMVSKSLLRSRLSDGETMISVTTSVPEKGAQSGLDVLGLNTGSGGSGGGSVHRELLRRVYIELTRIGYNVKLPDQNEEGELPDAIGRLPPEIDLSNMSLSQANRYLNEEYPEITKFSGDGQLTVEAESKGLTKPGGPVKNYAKAPDDEALLFVVADGGSDGFGNNARRLANIFTDPPMVNGRCPADVERKFYRKGKCIADGSVGFDDAAAGTEYAIYPKAGITGHWVEHADGSIVCRTSDGEVIARFEDYSAFASRSPADFPGTMKYDTDNEVYVARWTDENGEQRRRKWASKKPMKKELTILQHPTIPELLFGGEDQVPTPEDVAEDIYIGIVPDEPEDETEPVPPIELYDIETGETESLDDYLDTDASREGRGRQSSTSNPLGVSEEDAPPESDNEDELSITERLDEMGL